MNIQMCIFWSYGLCVLCIICVYDVLNFFFLNNVIIFVYIHIVIGDTPPTRAPSSRLSEPCLLLLRLFIKQHILCGLMETGTSVRGADSGGCQGLPWSVWLNVHEQFIIVCNFSGYVTNGIWYGLRFKLMSYISVCIICIYLFSLFGAFICYIVTGLIFMFVL